MAQATKQALKQGDKVQVSGEVKWGDGYHTVSTTGVIEEWKKGAYALVTLEEVDNDFGVCIHVPKRQLEKLEEGIPVALAEERAEVDYLFLLEDNEVGYAYFFEGENCGDDDEGKYKVYLYQTRFPIEEFADEEKRSVLLEEAKLQIADVDTLKEAHEEILSYWFLPLSTPVQDMNVVLEDALKALSDTHPIISI